MISIPIAAVSAFRHLVTSSSAWHPGVVTAIQCDFALCRLAMQLVTALCSPAAAALHQQNTASCPQTLKRCLLQIAGTEVAVKVRHPGVVRAIQRDFGLMQRVAQLASLLPALRKMQLGETLAQFAAPLQEQVRLM